MNDSGLDARSESPRGVVSDGSKELWHQVRQRVVEPGGLYFWNKAICGFPDLTRRAHLPVCLFYEDDTIKHKLIEYPKSHLKTTCGTVGKTGHIFACRVVKGEDLIDRVALASSTKTNAMRFLRLISVLIQTNPMIHNFFPELLPDFGDKEVWNAEEITFPRIRKFTDPSVDTLGVGGSATSRHYTFIIEDDMLNEESADSPTAIRKAIDLHKYYTSLLVDDDSNFITNEHAWTEYDVNKHIIEEEASTAVFSVGATTGLNTDRSRHVPEHIVELTRAWDDGQCVWPERYGPKALAERRQKAGARIYNAVYENNPFDEDVVDFKESWLRYYEFTKDGDIRIMPTRGVEMEVAPIRNMYICGALDPALSVKSGAARSALTITAVDHLDRVFLLEAYARRLDPLVVLDDVIDLVKRWDCTRCAVESVLFQKVLVDVLERRCNQHGLAIGTFEEIKPPKGKNKEERIRALLGTAFSEGRVYIHSSQTDFINEYLHFPMGRTVDLLDAFAYASMLWASGTTDEDISHLRRQEQARFNAMDPVTGY